MDEHRSASKGFRVINTTPSPQHAVSALGKSGGVHASQVKSIHKQQTTIRKPIECDPEASSGGREWAEMTEGFHLEATLDLT